MKPLNFINLFSHDIERLGNFYQTVFELTQVEERTPVYRGYIAGGITLSISAWSIYDLLSLTPHLPEHGDQAALTFVTDDAADLQATLDRALALGASMVREPFRTSYGFMMAVLRDPDGNPVRISYSLG